MGRKVEQKENGKLFIEKRFEGQRDNIVQIGVYGNDGEYQVLTVGFSVHTNTFNVNVQPTEEISLCDNTKIVDLNKKCEKVTLFTQKEG